MVIEVKTRRRTILLAKTWMRDRKPNQAETNR